MCVRKEKIYTVVRIGIKYVDHHRYFIARKLEHSKDTAEHKGIRIEILFDIFSKA